MIAADGDPIEPVVVENSMIGTAQRYDVLVALPESGSNTVHAAALGDDKQALGVLHTPDVAPAANGERPKFAGKTLKLTDLKAPYVTNPPDGPHKTFEVVLSGDMRNDWWKINGRLWPEPVRGVRRRPCRRDLLRRRVRRGRALRSGQPDAYGPPDAFARAQLPGGRWRRPGARTAARHLRRLAERQGRDRGRRLG